jgi:hypothetical protein
VKHAPTSAPAVAAKGSTPPFFDENSLLRDIANIDTKERLPNARCSLGHRTIRRDSGHAHFSLLVDSQMGLTRPTMEAANIKAPA